SVETRIRESAAARPNTRRAARTFPASAFTGTPCVVEYRLQGNRKMYTHWPGGTTAAGPAPAQPRPAFDTLRARAYAHGARSRPADRFLDTATIDDACRFTRAPIAARRPCAACLPARRGSAGLRADNRHAALPRCPAADRRARARPARAHDARGEVLAALHEPGQSGRPGARLLERSIRAPDPVSPFPHQRAAGAARPSRTSETHSFGGDARPSCPHGVAVANRPHTRARAR